MLKKFFMMIVSLFIIVSLFSVMPIYAHPASNILLEVKDTMLMVTVEHDTSKPESHYIDEITVILNGNKIITQLFSMQTGNTQNVSYIIPSLKSGDSITVDTHCSKGGNLKKTITVT